MLVQARAEGWQFGRDLIFTWGPWGFLQSNFHLGDTAAPSKLIWESAGRLLLAAAFVAALRGLPWGRQLAAVAVLVALSWLFVDAALMFFIALVVLRILFAPGRESTWREWLWLAGLTFLAHFKFTYTVEVGAGIAAAAVAQWRRGERRRAGLTLAIAAGTYLASWMAAGQHPDNLVPYLRRSLEIAAGYGDAMGVDETAAVFWTGLTTLLLAGAFLFRCLRVAAAGAGCAGLFAAFTVFLAWKHGFTRADGHVFGFFLFVLLLVTVAPALLAGARRWHWFDLAALPCLLGIHWAEPTLLARVPDIAWSRVRANAGWLARPHTWRDHWREEHRRAVTAAQLPGIARRVGSASIDHYNYEQALLLLNGWNYRPRPIFQSYSAYTARLQARNLRFYQSAGAPEFLLWKQISIDGRYPSLDDALLVAELPGRYAPVHEENGFTLLARRQPIPERRRAQEPLLTKSVVVGEWIDLPLVRDRAVWLRADLPLSKLGRLRALFYKPPPLFLVVTDDTGRTSSWRLLPRVAAEGFVLAPVLEAQDDFVSFLQGQGNRWVTRVRLETTPGAGEFWGRFSLWFSTLPEVALRAGLPYRDLVTAGIVSHAPATVESPHALETFALGPARAVQVHAPARMRFDVPADATRFTARFGLRDEATTGAARSDGVEFELTALWPDGREEVLARRRLDPRAVPADRGPQAWQVALPGERPSQLEIRISAGPAGDESWDWSYLAHARFEP